MDTGKRMEIRCCCDCSLIGTVPDTGFQVGTFYKLPVVPPSGPALRIDGAETDPSDGLDFECATYADGRVVRTAKMSVGPVSMFGIELDISRQVALKSRDYPIEQIRRIPGFVEATAKELRHDREAEARKIIEISDR